MSIAGIASSSLFQNSVVQQTQNRFQQIQSQFQKLGQDLQSGNLTQAQSDFSALSQELPNGGQFGASSATTTAAPTGATPSSTSNPILQAFQSLGKDLQSGNLTAAQQDFATIQQSAQQAQASGQAHHGHHHHHSGGDSQLQFSGLHAPARLHVARSESAIRQSFFGAAGLLLAAIRLAAIPPELRFRLRPSGAGRLPVRNHRRQRHRLMQTTSPNTTVTRRDSHRQNKIHQGAPKCCASFHIVAAPPPPSPETNRRIPNSACVLTSTAIPLATSQKPNQTRAFLRFLLPRNWNQTCPSHLRGAPNGASL